MALYHIVNLIADPGPTVTIEGKPGINGIRFVGSFPQQTNITLQWHVGDGGVPLSASGIYWPDPVPSANTGRLVVKGILYDARGSDSADYISGNIYDNVLFGDGSRSGPGGDDVLFGDEGNDTIYGGKGKDDIGGAEGDDTLLGDDGNDKISGGSGVDLVEGGAGADVLSGGAGLGDTVSYQSSDARVRIKLTPGDTTVGKGGHAEGDTINGFTDVIGSRFNDVITDTVKGSVGLDGNRNTFYGLGGDDILTLGGNDDIGVGGSGNDTLLGENGDDTLRGDGGRDRLDGGAGNDVLIGGGSADVLVGRAGADDFVFLRLADSTRKAAGRDTILDFSRAHGDRIDLSAIDANSNRSGDQSFVFIGRAEFSGKARELRFEKAGTKTFVYADVNGDAVADFAIVLENKPGLKAGDFVL